MKNCVECNIAFGPKKPFEKYCSLKCCKKFQYRIEINRRRSDSEYREKRSEDSLS